MPRQNISVVEKINWLELIIGKCNNECVPVKENKLISWMWTKWGTTQRTAKEYLQQLENSGLIVIFEGECFQQIAWEKMAKARERDGLKLEAIMKAIEEGKVKELIEND